MKVIDQAFGERFALYQGDCCDVVQGIPESSIHFTIFSPPFASLYVYSDSERDMGNNTDAGFTKHFQFLVKDLLRVTMPGRLCAVHCMDLPSMAYKDGFIGLKDFRGDVIRAFQSEGWIYHSSVTVWKDPVTQMQRTKALGLLYKQLRKDSAMSRQGLPDYLVVFRKPGVNPERVSHTPEDFSLDLWQRYASPVWMDINPSDTLQFRSARENDDERHICPLQLEVIRRACVLWSNPGDTVLSPFAGIGSEGHIALGGTTITGADIEPRRFVGIELKGSYFEAARQNLAAAERGTGKQPDLFSAMDLAECAR